MHQATFTVVQNTIIFFDTITWETDDAFLFVFSCVSI